MLKALLRAPVLVVTVVLSAVMIALAVVHLALGDGSGWVWFGVFGVVLLGTGFAPAQRRSKRRR